MLVGSFFRQLKGVVDQLQEAAASGSWVAFESAQSSAQHYHHLTALARSCADTFKQRQAALQTELESAVGNAPVAAVEALMLKGVDLGIPKQKLAQSLEAARERDQAATDALWEVLRAGAGFSVAAFEAAAGAAMGLGLKHEVAAATQELGQRRAAGKQVLQLVGVAADAAQVHAACSTCAALGMELEVEKALEKLQLRQDEAVAALHAKVTTGAATADVGMGLREFQEELAGLRKLGVKEEGIAELKEHWAEEQAGVRQQLLQAATGGGWEEFKRAQGVAHRFGVQDVQQLLEQFQGRRVAAAHKLAAAAAACCQCLGLDNDEALQLLQSAGGPIQAYLAVLELLADAASGVAIEKEEDPCSSSSHGVAAAASAFAKGSTASRNMEDVLGSSSSSSSVCIEVTAAVGKFADGVFASMQPFAEALLNMQKQLQLTNALGLDSNAWAACWALGLQCTQLMQKGEEC